MCITASTPRREHRLWRVMVDYFRAYPPLVQAESLSLCHRLGPRKSVPSTAARAERPRIRIYW